MERTPEPRRRCISTPIGALTLVSDGHALVQARLGGCDARDACPVLDWAQRELEEYFAGSRRVFCVPLRPLGTPFRLRVWSILRKIPYGQTRSYSEVALAVGNPGACRAVGQANHFNPLLIFVPCHRVINAGGGLGGYAGGLEVKRWLLALEQKG